MENVQSAEDLAGVGERRRALAGACLAHLLHDGYTDQLYALLPVWQGEFGLSYAGLALVRGLYYGTMGALQVPGDRVMGGRVSARVALVGATLLAAVGCLVMAVPVGGLVALCAGLVVAGVGSSVQHPRGSMLVAEAYGKEARGPLGVYNFSGDLGKAIFPAVVALLLPVMAWRSVVGLVGVAGVVVAGVLVVLIPRQKVTGLAAEKAPAGVAGDGRGFGLLMAIGALDTAVRMGYLLFLPFLIRADGGAERAVGVGLALLFIGGAFGKAVCGWLGGRFGVVGSVVVTEVATGGLIVATLGLPLWGMLVVLPVLGVVLNGTSSVLYGTVPDLAPRGEVGRGFALFYTGVIVMGGVAPIGYGMLADRSSRAVGIWASAITAVAIVPLVLALGRVMGERRALGGTGP